jgi:hypothetical protein
MKINPATQFVSIQYFSYGFAVLAVLTVENYVDLSTDELCELDGITPDDHPAKVEIARIIESRIPKEEPEKKGAEMIGRNVLFEYFGKYYEYKIVNVSDDGQAFKKEDGNWIDKKNYRVVEIF